MTLHVRTVALADGRPLIDLVPLLPAAGRLVLVGGDVGFVGAGSALEIPVGIGPDRGARAMERLGALLDAAYVSDPVDRRGTGPVALGSLTFDPDRPGSVLRIPSVLVGRGDGRTWVTTAAVDADPPDWTPSDATTPDHMTPRDRPRFAGSSLRDDRWLGVVADAVAAVTAGELEKVVLARDHHLWAEAPFDVAALVAALAERFPSCRTFAVDGLVGASPEPLLHVDGRTVRSRVLAGTAPRGRTGAEDLGRWEALLASAKDRHEHLLAVASVVDPLRELGAEVDAPTMPSRLALDNVQHLATDVVAHLPSAQPSLRLLDVVHPTAAIGGAPTEAALDVIRRTEGMDRGRYAGPVGWTDGAGDGEWALALRCAEIDGDRARLFAGAGIVAGSLPELELVETQLKLRAMLRILEGLGAERPDPARS